MSIMKASRFLPLIFALSSLSSAQWWLGQYNHIGKVAFQPDPNYKAWRNVLDYGCDNTGVVDATQCINDAIQDPGNRCGGGDVIRGTYCESSTITPALVYFPSGTYRVSGNLVMYYKTQIVGDAVNPPTFKVDANYKNDIGLAVFDSNIYIPDASGAQWHANQNNFFRQLRNVIIDMTEAPTFATGIHWQVAQATHLNNVRIRMRPKGFPGNEQQGIYAENGSGGFMSDIFIEGGKIGATLGAQQFTTRNLQISNSATAIQMVFDWVWLYTDLKITGCDVGLDMSSGGFSNQAIGSVIVADSSIQATQGILTPYAPGYSSPQSAGSLMLENVDFTGTPQAVAAAGGTASRTILAGNQKIDLWAQGNAWTTAAQSLNGQTFNGTTCSYGNTTEERRTAQEITIQRSLSPIERPAPLVDANGKWFSRSKPQYEDFSLSQISSALGSGLAGDGQTDDTVAMQNFLNSCSSSGNICYFDKGAYIITDTVNVPSNIRIVGELYSIIMGTGPNFQDVNNPRPMWRVGNRGDVGNVEIQDLMWETRGPTPGAVCMEWNVKAASPGSAGMWDAHFRIGSTAGTDLQQDRCIKTPEIPVLADDPKVAECTAAFLLLHITSDGNGYFENIWGWVSDHELDMDTRAQTNIYNGRGFLIEGDGPNWLWGTSTEHSTLYNYQWQNTRNTFAGVIQTETAYYQGNPDALIPFVPQERWGDPTFADCEQRNCARTWGARFVNSSDIYVYGSGLYNFFENYNTPICLGTETCQERMVDIQNSNNIYLWAFSTKGSEFMVSYESTPLLSWSVNRAGFCATAILFELADDES
ncbi:hypothetical protein LTS08_004299 [Lithohypha guttulata]|nr:hypothetical protein LTS08_004299 [Lithohypha guttulata]